MNEIYSKQVAVEVDMGTEGSPDWKLLTCVISKSLSQTTDSTQINNDCTGDFVRNLPTDTSWQFTFDGNINSQPSASEISATEMLEIQKAKEIRNFRFSNPDESYYREGKGFISQADETGSAGEYLTFSSTITGTEELYTTPTT